MAEGVASMRYGIFIAMFALGCGGTAGFTNISDSPRKGVTDKPTEWQLALRQAEEIEANQDEAVVILKDNTEALARIEKQLEASMIVPKAEPGKEVIKSAPNPPAKANTALAPLKVATPGDSSRIASDGTVLKWNIEGNWNPTILETSAHLAAEHGIDTNGMTHQEMADTHAALHDGKLVAMKAKPVQYQPRSTYSVQSGCPGGVCPVPQRVSRRGRR